MRSQFDKDRWIVDYLDVAGVGNIARDLEMTERAVKARATRLRKSGAWAALERLAQAESRHMVEYFNALGIEHEIEDQPYTGLKAVEA